MGQVCLKIVDAGKEGGERHERHKGVGDYMTLCREGEDKRLEDYDERADHLRDGLYLAEHACRNDDAALTCNYKSKTCNAKLTQKDKKDKSHKYKRLGTFTDKEKVCHNSDLRADDHKFIGKGVDKLSEIGNEVVFSCNLAVKHIGKGGKKEYNRRNDKSPYCDITHQNERKNERRNEKNSYKR